MHALPVVAITPADAGEIRTGALTAPLERMVVNRFTGDGVVPIALHFRRERSDHLRMTVVATFADVDVSTCHFQWRIGLEARCGFDDLRLEHQRHDFDKPADADD